VPPSMFLPINQDTTKSKTFISTAFTPTNSQTAVGFPLDTVDRGTGDNERIGSKWMPTAVHLRGVVNANPLGNDTQVLGYYVVWDKSPNGASAPFNQVFTGSTPMFAFPSSTSDDRFKVIFQKRYNLTIQNTIPGEANSNSQHLVDQYIKLPPRLVCHSVLGSTVGSIAERSMGALLLYAYTRSGARSTTTAIMTVSHRLYFNDV